MKLIEVRRKDIKDWVFAKPLFKLLDEIDCRNGSQADISVSLRVGSTQWVVTYEPKVKRG